MYPLLEAAIRSAVKWHAGQYRDGDSALPYIAHPFDVLSNLRNIGGVADEAMLCAAMLHDVVEECDVSPSKIEKKFGRQVANLVVELTREEPDEETWASLSPTDLYDLRNRMLLDGIKKMGPEAMQVKLADRLSNVLEAKRTRTGDKLQRYLTQTEQILQVIPRDVNPALWDAVDAART